MIEGTTRTDPVGTVRRRGDGATVVKVSMGDDTGKGQHVWCWMGPDLEVRWLHHYEVSEWPQADPEKSDAFAELEGAFATVCAERDDRQARLDAALTTGSEDEQDDLTRALTAAESCEAYGWPIVADVLRHEILRVRAALTTDPPA